MPNNPKPAERRLLILEDKPELLQIIVEFCRPLTQHIFTGMNGLEGLKILQHQTVHTVLSDMMMPQMSGLQLLRKIRNDGFETPFIFLTGNTDFQSTEMASRYGAIDFYEKPLLEKKMLLSLDRALDFGVELERIQAGTIESVKKEQMKAWKTKLQQGFQKARDNI